MDYGGGGVGGVWLRMELEWMTPEKNMRLFISIQFDEEILGTLTELQDDLREQGMEGRYSDRANLHLTLAFIGEYGNPDEVMDALEESDFRPLSIRLEGVGSFGDTFWAGISENRALMSYVKRLRKVLSDHGIPFDRKRFNPHITLARKVRFDKGLPAVSIPAREMMVERISLMRSDRGKHGIIYTEIGCV